MIIKEITLPSRPVLLSTSDTPCYCQYTKMGSNNNDIPDGLSIVDKYVQIAINKLHLLKYFNI